MATSTTTMRAVYQRGEGVKPRVHEEVVAEARDYLARDRQVQLAFLREVYQQVVSGKDGSYAQRFSRREGEIAAVLNYFADRLRGLGQTTEADRLEAAVRAQFPEREEKKFSDLTNKIDPYTNRLFNKLA